MLIDVEKILLQIQIQVDEAFYEQWEQYEGNIKSISTWLVLTWLMIHKK
jgi:hypothetical protein